MSVSSGVNVGGVTCPLDQPPGKQGAARQGQEPGFTAPSTAPLNQAGFFSPSLTCPVQRPLDPLQLFFQESFWFKQHFSSLIQFFGSAALSFRRNLILLGSIILYLFLFKNRRFSERQILLLLAHSAHDQNSQSQGTVTSSSITRLPQHQPPRMCILVKSAENLCAHHENTVKLDYSRFKQS